MQFGKWRAFFWPIHRWELKKFLPMFFMFFLISFNYNALRSYKDTVIITAQQSGAEAIPFIKMWAVLPSAILLTLVFARLANRFSREKIFYIMMSMFLIMFFLFTFILYPYRDFLHPHALADRLQAVLPVGCKGFIAIFRNWTFTLFYCLCELWSTAIMSVLFWGFANEVTNIDEARRYYGILATGGSIAGIFSGQIAIFYSGNIFLPWLPYGKNAWDQSLFFVTCTVIVAGLATIALFRWLNKYALTPSEKSSTRMELPKTKISMRENFAYLARSKYLICIAIIVMAYNLSLNLVEVSWKNQMKELYPAPNDYNTYMSQVMVVMSILASLVGLLTTSNIIRRYSWRACAMIPLVIVGFTGSVFFAFALFQQWGLHWNVLLYDTSPLVLSVTLGSIQNCLSRAAKYTFFDATKEMAFIPLSPTSKLKGKAAIDGVGSRLGKSGGSVIYQGLLLCFSTVALSTPYIAVIFLFVLLIWGATITSLGQQFNQLTTNNVKLEVANS